VAPAGGKPQTVKPAETEATPPGKAPNTFALRPGRFTARDALTETMRTRALASGLVAAALCCLLAAVALRFPGGAASAGPPGPLAMASDAQGRLYMLLPDALLVHARSGLGEARVEAEGLGLAELGPPLHTTGGSVLLNGRARGSDDFELQRCNLVEFVCTPQGIARENGAQIRAIAESTLGDSLFLLDEAGGLRRVDRTGRIEARAQIDDARAEAGLLYRAGLLLIPSRSSPLVAVFRPDRAALGRQLDALLPSPASGTAADMRHILSIAATDADRYAIIAGEDGAAALWHFDVNWGLGRRLADVPPSPGDAFLATWRDRVLLASPGQAAVTRVAPGGRVEAPFESALLRAEREAWQSDARRRALLDRFGRSLLCALAGMAVLSALLHGAAASALTRLPRTSTQLLDPLPAGIGWSPRDPRSADMLRRISVLLPALAFAALCAGLLLAPPARALAFAPLLLGTLYAALCLRRGGQGHLGRVRRRLILVDHRNQYFFGAGKTARRGAGFLFAGAVAVPAQLFHDAPTMAGDAVDPWTVLGQLWLLQHPWLHGALAVLVGAGASLGLLLPQA
jgi:hypothetical protein